MAAISLKLPDDLARESKEIADKIGITRTELIRRALRHELAYIEARLERDAMAKALRAMRNDPAYVREGRALDDGLGEPLPEEPERWWEG
jgi:metal-responsive CopG/Arc/MetJ family transcriptional regulator